MSKAILEFTLPEETEEHQHALNGIKYHSAMHDFSEWLRKRDKHTEPCKKGVDELEAIRAEWWEIVGGMLE